MDAWKAEKEVKMIRETPARIILIGCGKTKRTVSCSAADMYEGSLFRARLAHARRSGCPWWIISAKHGLLSPSTVIEPYDVSIESLAAIDRIAWPVGVVQQLLSQLSDDFEPRRCVVEIHAGASYADGLSSVLAAVSINVAMPLKGLGIGEQMQWYFTRQGSLAC